MHCVPTEGIYLYVGSRAMPWLKSTRTFPERKGMPILEWPRNSLDMNPIEYNDEIGNQMPCKKKDLEASMWSVV